VPRTFGQQSTIASEYQQVLSTLNRQGDGGTDVVMGDLVLT
jgi:hypothetical protein